MGYVEFVHTEFNSSPSPRESARFGYETDRITIGGRAREAEPDMDRLASITADLVRKSSASIKIIRFPSEILPLFRSLEVTSGRILPAGALMYWEHSAGAQMPLSSDAHTDVRSHHRSGQWLEEVTAIIGDSFEGYVNHYSVNPLIPRGVTTDGYMEWALVTLSSPHSLVFTVSNDLGKTVGAAVVSIAGEVWEIELASIAQDSQRHGYYLKLMTRILAEAHARGAARVVISTQSHNIGVQRAWVRLGFSPILSIETVHIIDKRPGISAGTDKG